MKLTLRTQIMLLVAGTVACLTLIVMVAINMLVRIETDASVRRDVQGAGGVFAQLIRDRSQSLTDTCRLLSGQPRLIYLRGANAATIADSLHEWLPKMHADEAILTDGNGVIKGATNKAECPGSDLSGDPGIGRALDGSPWSGVVTKRNQLMLAVSVPVVDGASHVVTMTFTVYSKIDSRLAGELRRALGSDVAFVDHGRVIGGSVKLPSSLSAPRRTPSILTISGRRYIALYADLPCQPALPDVGFITLRPYDAAMAPFQQFQRNLLLLSVGALALALACSYPIARGVTRPLDGIMDAARQLSRGEWPQQFAVKRQDEIGLLQSVFNEMASALKSQQERLLALIDVDALTGLDNHRRFQERLAQETQRSIQTKEPLSLVLIDIDDFGNYNKLHGHIQGDAALQSIAELLKATLPETAVPARYGGEEFVVLLPHQTLEMAAAIAEEIRGRLRFVLDVPKVNGRPALPLTVSIGCAERGPSTAQAEGLVLAAELAVSRAKSLGRDQVCRFDNVEGYDQDSDPYHLHRFLKDSSLATIQALAAAVDAKDPYTRGHSRRVAEYASSLAEFVGVSHAEQELIYTTGTLHDVGKIGVPDSILNKPGRLDEDERTIMETHPALGEVIVRKAPALAATLPGVRHHHERWDGKGYPDGLAGEEIARLARFLAVADTFDAMTSDRPYRKGLPRDFALNEISKGAGSQFDPELAEAFVRWVQIADGGLPLAA